MKAIINAKIYDYLNYIENGYIIFDHQIIDVGHMDNYRGHHEVFDAKGKFVIPGLINGHTHIYSTLFRGSPMMAAPKTFQGVLDEIWWPFDKALDLKAIKTSAYAYGVESLKNGVTSLIDHHASGVIEDSLMTIHHALEDIGIKHLLCFETSDRFDFIQCLSENEYATKHHGHFGMHASLSISEETMDKVAEVIGNKPIHVHVAEALLDEEDSLSKYQMRVVERLNKYKLLNEDSILGHCIHIDENEADLIKENKCYVAINPSSNLNNAVGMYNSKLMIDKALKIIVGTDGLGVNVAKEYQNLYYVGKQSMDHPSGVEMNWVKDIIIDSYQYFGRRSGHLIGQIKPSYDSDFLIVDYDFITPITKDNVFAHVFFGMFDSLRPLAVYSGGIKRIDQYQYIYEQKGNVESIYELWGRL